MVSKTTDRWPRKVEIEYLNRIPFFDIFWNDFVLRKIWGKKGQKFRETQQHYALFLILIFS